MRRVWGSCCADVYVGWLQHWARRSGVWAVCGLGDRGLGGIKAGRGGPTAVVKFILLEFRVVVDNNEVYAGDLTLAYICAYHRPRNRGVGVASFRFSWSL